MKSLFYFFFDGFKHLYKGGPSYYAWVIFLKIVMLVGLYAWYIQIRDGLQVTGMSDHVSWGFYISNFTFFVGVAAAAVMLVLPAYVLHDSDFSQAVLLGEGVAVSALIICIGFVGVDVGRPDRLWHMIPFIGNLHFPESMLAWDLIVLNGYLALNSLIPFYILFCKYRGIKPNNKLYVPFVYLSVFWAVGIHMVTAFLYAGLTARPYWNSSLLGPRFLASAFAAGPAVIIMVLMVIRNVWKFPIRNVTLDKLAMIATVAAQVNLIMLGSEIFKEFYWPTEHSQSAQYLFFGLHGHDALKGWIWFSIILNIIVTGFMMVHPIRKNHRVLPVLCLLLFISIWIEKGLGIIVPGFIPSPLGEIVEYTPSHIELMVSAGIIALGIFIFTCLSKVAVGIEKGEIKKSQ
ncbi:MAG: polysulfide reductase NrfD [Lentisphaeria bacterium]|nr:polysulfide reductase NrfD [Lentisphaeria bacterium]